MNRLYEAMLDKISLPALKNVCMMILVVTAVLLGISVMREVMRGGYGGEEVVEVHITSDGLLRAISRVSVTRCPNYATYMPIRLPHDKARLESVTVGGRNIPFKTGQGIPDATPNTYYAMTSLPGKAMRDALVEAIWSIPLADTYTKDGHVRVLSRGVIPVRSLAVNVVLDDGAPFKFTGKFADVKDYNLFTLGWNRYIDCDYDAYYDIELQPNP